MLHHETLQQLARDHGDQRGREASAERLALKVRGTRHSRSWRVVVGAARLRSPFAGKDERPPAYRRSA
jgi:hypothetical protein